MISGYGISLALEHDNATGEASDYIEIEVRVSEATAMISTHSGSRHVEATMSHEALGAFATDILAILRRAKVLPLQDEESEDQ